MGQSVLAADKKPLTKEESAKVLDAAIREALTKQDGLFILPPLGDLTKADKIHF
jgi:hypothetical protein